MRYRLWDTDINRLFGTYASEAEALDFARTLIRTYGEEAAADLALGCEFPDGSFSEPLTGAALIARVRDVLADSEPISVGRDEVVASRRV